MGFTEVPTFTTKQKMTPAIFNTYLGDNLNYLKGIDGVPTIESGLIIDNTDGDEYFQLPSLTTTERNALSGVNGMLIYNETTSALNAYEGGAWGAAGVKDHGALTGLGDDDHTIYLLADGTRNLTGNLTVSASVTIDGIDISAHDIATTSVHGAGAYTLLHTGDVDDTPINGATTAPVSSNWAYDHKTDDDVHNATAINVAVLSTPTPTYDDVQDYINQYGNRGIITGFTVSETAHDGTVAVAAGTGWVKTGNTINSAGVFFNFAGDPTVSLTDNSKNYVYLDYNFGGSGVPGIAVDTTGSLATNYDHILLASTWRAGTEVHVLNVSYVTIDSIHKALTFADAVFGVRRTSGIVTASTGTRQITISAGTMYASYLAITALSYDTSSVASGNVTSTDTNKLIDSGASFTANDVGKSVKNTTDNTYSSVDEYVSGTELLLHDDIFPAPDEGDGYQVYDAWSSFYSSDGGTTWVETEHVTQIDNTYYNKLTEPYNLVELTTKRYAVHWLYLDYEGKHIYMVYGQDDYTANKAEEASVPASLPPIVVDFGVLIAKIIVQKADSTLIITHPWTTVFTSSLATDHNSLANLTTGDVHTQYFLLAGEATDAKLYSGADLIVYSGAGSGEVARIDGATGAITSEDTTDSSSITTGSIQTDGGVGVAKNLYTGTTSSLCGGVAVFNSWGAVFGDAYYLYMRTNYSAYVASIDSGYLDLYGQSGIRFRDPDQGVVLAWDATTNVLATAYTLRITGTLDMGQGTGTMILPVFSDPVTQPAEGTFWYNTTKDKVEFATASGMETVVTLAATQTLTNKTLTSPAINGTVTTTGLTMPAFISGIITTPASGAIMKAPADNNLIYWYGGTAHATGASIALSGKDEESSGYFFVYTPNAAGNSGVGRLQISGKATTAEATWSNITHRGIVLSGNLTCAGTETIDGIDVSAHDVATTGVHGVGGNTIIHSGDTITSLTADTLANYNTKVSDATLLDEGTVIAFAVALGG